MNSSVSRGLAIKRLAALPFAALAVRASSRRRPKLRDNKKQFKYQDKPGPKGEKCAGCRFFKKPDACTIVTGKISPNGWCIAYARS